MSKKNRVGVVYSTNPDYQYDYDLEPEAETLPASRQRLRLAYERKGRGGKEVTLVTGFVGTEADLQALAKLLKSRCGIGGSAKDGEIVLQGNQLDKARAILTAEGYPVKG